jgi:hypothetical protein
MRASHKKASTMAFEFQPLNFVSFETQLNKGSLYGEYEPLSNIQAGYFDTFCQLGLSLVHSAQHRYNGILPKGY